MKNNTKFLLVLLTVFAVAPMAYSMEKIKGIFKSEKEKSQEKEAKLYAKRPHASEEVYRFIDGSAWYERGANPKIRLNDNSTSFEVLGLPTSATTKQIEERYEQLIDYTFKLGSNKNSYESEELRLEYEYLIGWAAYQAKKEAVAMQLRSAIRHK